jgi:hypothetical protein
LHGNKYAEHFFKGKRKYRKPEAYVLVGSSGTLEPAGGTTLFAFFELNFNRSFNSSFCNERNFTFRIKA